MEYTIPAVAAALLVILAERFWLRTGLFKSPSYWATLAICAFFMVLVDGWLTKRSAPIVTYDDGQRLFGRFPWDIPLEDFFYGYALITAVLLLWVRQDSVRGTDR